MGDARRSLVGLVIGSVVAVAGCSSTHSTGPTPPDGPSVFASTGFDVPAAGAYCTSKGGTVVTRLATWNTNQDQAAWLPLGGVLQLCEFERGTGEDATRISVDLVTLYSQQPTIAAVAYLSKVPPLMPPQPSANPAQYNCEEQLDGTASWGNTNTAGGWVDAGQPVFKVMNLCMFADGSAIDEFGIFYYANGTVRGADLAPILRYQPNGKLPSMFQQVRR